MTATHPASIEARPGAIRVVASAALVLTGLLTAGYGVFALGAARADVIGPALIIIAVGLLGLRWPVVLWLAPVPLVLHLTLSAPTLAYDLARPSQLAYAVPSALVLVAAAVAAVTGPVAALGSRAARVPTWGVVIATLAIAIAAPVMVLMSNEASRDPGRGIEVAEASSAFDVAMRDYIFDPGMVVVPSEGGWIHLRNVGERPHDFRVPALDIDVYVPAGRDTYVKLPSGSPIAAPLWCGVGDHEVLGMLGTVARA